VDRRVSVRSAPQEAPMACDACDKQDTPRGWQDRKDLETTPVLQGTIGFNRLV
jgi:hypothetical protein